MASYCITLHCIALRCIAFHCISLHCIALHCIALHYITFHFIIFHYIPQLFWQDARLAWDPDDYGGVAVVSAYCDTKIDIGARPTALWPRRTGDSYCFVVKTAAPDG